MRKIIFLLCIAFLAASANAQDQGGGATKVSDQYRIALTPVVPSDAAVLPAGARPVLLNRLRQLSTANGYGGSALVPQFIIAANPVLVDKKVAGTAPTTIWAEFELTLYIADHVSRTVFATTTVNIKGMGATDDEAYTDAFRSFKINSKEIKDFAQKGRNEIITYYNTQCDIIMARADQMVAVNQFDQALALLMSVPDAGKSCFDMAVAKTAKVYQLSVDQHCNELLQAARSAWASSPNRAGADRAADLIAVIAPQAKCNPEAQSLLNEIKTKMLELEQWDRKVYSDQLDLTRRYIQMLRDVGVAYGSNQPDQVINVKGWLW